MKKFKEFLKKHSISSSSSKRRSTQLVEQSRNAARSALSGRKQEPEDVPFRIEMNTTPWPVYDISESIDEMIDAAGKLLIDITGNPGMQWARGENVGLGLGKKLFAVESESPWRSNVVPPRLFDLTTNQVVSTKDMEDTPGWAAISHVWGEEPTEIDGRRYGVDWKIPIRTEEKLAQILEAARVVVGERYVWMDVLCMDQRSEDEKKNNDASEDEDDDEDDGSGYIRWQREGEIEMGNMREYFENAVGCFVWLDNGGDDPAWPEILDSIQELNRFFRMDKHGRLFPEAVERLMRHEQVYDASIPDHEASVWMNHLTTLEKAPWFKRVWTLQEAVVPEKVWFCTPERYMTGGSQMWILSALLEAVSRRLVAAGSIAGVKLAHDLQRSEIYKTAKLRRLDRRNLMCFWHVVQAAASRQCKLEHDRIFGVAGLVMSQGGRPHPNYSRSVEDFYDEMYRVFTFTGDFDATLFIGGPSTILPKIGESTPLFTSRTLRRRGDSCVNVLRDRDSLMLHRTFCWYNWVTITALTPIQGWGALEAWGGKSTQITTMSPDMQREVARAFELDDTLFTPSSGDGSLLCSGAIAAAIAPTLDSLDQPLRKLQPDVRAKVKRLLPAALMRWLQILFVVQRESACALVAIKTDKSGTKLALIIEQPAGEYVAVMPGSYIDEPSPGFVLCRTRDDGTVVKVGVGFGRNMTATESKGQIEMFPA